MTESRRPLVDREDLSAHNPAAPSRRTLLKALGLIGASSGVALSWERPIVSFGGIPVHAQATEADACQVATLGFSISKPGAGNIVFESATDGGVTTPLTDFDFTDTASYQIVVTGSGDEDVYLYFHGTWATTSGASYELTSFRTCCTVTQDAFTTREAFGGSGSSYSANFDDDGYCAVEL